MGAVSSLHVAHLDNQPMLNKSVSRIYQHLSKESIMLNWIRGKITHMVVETKVTQGIKVLESYSKLMSEAYAPAFMFGANQGLELIPKTISTITSDKARLVRLVETWLPVFESAKIAWDLSRDDIIPIALDIKKLAVDAVAAEVPEEIITAEKNLNVEVTKAIDEFKS